LGFLLSPEISSCYGIKPTAFLEVIELVMYNNCMHFGDVFIKQVSGLAMGMSPAPTLANFFVAIYKEDYVPLFVPATVMYQRCFIDDGFRPCS
jgi:hypothetical protein